MVSKTQLEGLQPARLGQGGAGGRAGRYGNRSDDGDEGHIRKETRTPETAAEPAHDVAMIS